MRRACDRSERFREKENPNGVATAATRRDGGFDKNEAARPSRDARDLSAYSFRDYYMIRNKIRLRHGWLSGSLHGNTLGDVAVLAVSNSTPSAVTAMVCSYCAERLPSLVTAVHPSGHVTSL